jgi:hypothetical protein
MRLALLGSVALLLAAAVGADAATSTRYAVTLTGTVVDGVTFDRSQPAGAECRIHRHGTGRRTLSVISVRATAIAVSRSGRRVAYRPVRLPLRIRGTVGRGTYTETKICRAAPLEQKQADCRGETLAPRRVSGSLARPAAGRVGFAAPKTAEQVGACGLERLVPGGWLDHAAAKIDEAALLRGARRVVAKGSATGRTLISDPTGARVERQTTVRWTLTFRRLG